MRVFNLSVLLRILSAISTFAFRTISEGGRSAEPSGEAFRMSAAKPATVNWAKGDRSVTVSCSPNEK